VCPRLSSECLRLSFRAARSFYTFLAANPPPQVSLDPSYYSDDDVGSSVGTSVSNAVASGALTSSIASAASSAGVSLPVTPTSATAETVPDPTAGLTFGLYGISCTDFYSAGVEDVLYSAISTVVMCINSATRLVCTGDGDDDATRGPTTSPTSASTSSGGGYGAYGRRLTYGTDDPTYGGTDDPTDDYTGCTTCSVSLETDLTLDPTCYSDDDIGAAIGADIAAAVSSGAFASAIASAASDAGLSLPVTLTSGSATTTEDDDAADDGNVEDVGGTDDPTYGGTDDPTYGGTDDPTYGGTMAYRRLAPFDGGDVVGDADEASSKKPMLAPYASSSSGSGTAVPMPFPPPAPSAADDVANSRRRLFTEWSPDVDITDSPTLFPTYAPTPAPTQAPTPVPTLTSMPTTTSNPTIAPPDDRGLTLTDS